MYPVICQNVQDLENDLLFVMEEIKWKKNIKPGERVLIKPNLLTKFTPGVTTTKEVLFGVINILRDRTDEIFVVETDSSGRSAKGLFNKIDLDIPFINLSDEKLIKVDGKFGSYDLPQIALESKIVNIPVFKTHILTRVTGGIKNIFGLLPEKEKEKFHWNIDQVLYDLYSAFKPSINILDGLYSMDENGPMDGRVIKTDFLMASSDALALDMAVCETIGLNFSDVNHLTLISKGQNIDYKITGENLLIPELTIPKVGKIEKTGALLQKYTLTRELIKQPAVNKLAKKVKALLG